MGATQGAQILSIPPPPLPCPLLPSLPSLSSPSCHGIWDTSTEAHTRVPPRASLPLRIASYDFDTTIICKPQHSLYSHIFNTHKTPRSIECRSGGLMPIVVSSLRQVYREVAEGRGSSGLYECAQPPRISRVIVRLHRGLVRLTRRIRKDDGFP